MPKLLLVEDNEMNRDMLSRRLKKRGFEVELAVDGIAGAEMALAGGHDLILLDMSLPGMTGWDVARKLKADPAVAAVPIIALTAHAMESDRQQALEAGCDEFETKPVNLKDLLAKVNRLLGLEAAE
ncbi:response regulator [Synoicihabitans lomoniglobus]|uniref:Response regulator n=1 Tax=Synoicihabitans lomoniglobus TaxID=2909285 RepID=A0AAF0CIK8_9BACT|nr:response regulator [Opitutaceae bacterium LMO-M01]WED65522.1 response regulator [Opitutaceae bacterium LMO-M01]